MSSTCDFSAAASAELDEQALAGHGAHFAHNLPDKPKGHANILITNLQPSA
jgi:hypothetical protein